MIKPQVIWFTGLSGAGKTTLASYLAELVEDAGHLTYSIDGDQLRKSSGSNLSYSKEDRSKNARRATDLANQKMKEGFVVIVSLISPFAEDRKLAKETIGPDNFKEIYVSTPLKICIQRDPKGLYQKAKKGQIQNMTGISSPYEVPTEPDMTIDTSNKEPKELAKKILFKLKI